jgi:hypothetical protein
MAEKISWTSKQAVKSYKKPKEERKFSAKIDVAKTTSNIVPENYPQVPKLQVFDVHSAENKLPDGFFIICEGSRRVGKSIFLQWLFYFYRKDFDLVLVFSETPHNGFWQPIVGNQYVHNGWDPFVVEKLLDEQMKEVEKEKNDLFKVFKARRILLILDDVVGDRKQIHEDTTLNRLSVQGRHFRISIALTTQEPHAIGTALRNNCDLAVIFQQKSKRAKKSVCDDFLNFKLPVEWMAQDLLSTYTENHNAIAVKLWKLEKEVKFSYTFVPEEMTYDKKNEKSTVPAYQIGSKDQQTLAKTREGSLPLFT